MNHEVENSGENPIQIAKAWELSKINEMYEGKPPGILGNTTLFTPAEHKGIGSAFPGMGFHPNLPHALLLGSSLEEVNRKREGLIYCPMLWQADEQRAIRIPAKLLPLTQSQVDAEDAEIGFEITGSPSDLVTHIELEGFDEQKLLKIIQDYYKTSQEEFRQKLFLKLGLIDEAAA